MNSRRSLKKLFAVATLAAVSLLPLAAVADGEQGQPMGEDHTQQGCEVPGSANGLGDTLAIIARVACG